jgi:hypothetical protein
MSKDRKIYPGLGKKASALWRQMSEIRSLTGSLFPLPPSASDIQNNVLFALGCKTQGQSNHFSGISPRFKSSCAPPLRKNTCAWEPFALPRPKMHLNLFWHLPRKGFFRGKPEGCGGFLKTPLYTHLYIFLPGSSRRRHCREKRWVIAFVKFIFVTPHPLCVS